MNHTRMIQLKRMVAIVYILCRFRYSVISTVTILVFNLGIISIDSDQCCVARIHISTDKMNESGRATPFSFLLSPFTFTRCRFFGC